MVSLCESTSKTRISPAIVFTCICTRAPTLVRAACEVASTPVTPMARNRLVMDKRSISTSLTLDIRSVLRMPASHSFCRSSSSRLGVPLPWRSRSLLKGYRPLTATLSGTFRPFRSLTSRIVLASFHNPVYLPGMVFACNHDPGPPGGTSWNTSLHCPFCFPSPVSVSSTARSQPCCVQTTTSVVGLRRWLRNSSSTYLA
mmetsp:Transcript_51198/g.123184  ORF Transcript_51198/g.123184 Transcript_51198/m.123184 type:complete len:200 (+) Transcript_51198:732-1331(+)